MLTGLHSHRAVTEITVLCVMMDMYSVYNKTERNTCSCMILILVNSVLPYFRHGTATTCMLNMPWNF